MEEAAAAQAKGHDKGQGKGKDYAADYDGYDKGKGKDYAADDKGKGRSAWENERRVFDRNADYRPRYYLYY